MGVFKRAIAIAIEFDMTFLPVRAAFAGERAKPHGRKRMESGPGERILSACFRFFPTREAGTQAGQRRECPLPCLDLSTIL